MKLVTFIFLMSLTTAVAFATPFDRINRESSVCLEKTYSAEYLRAHPLQTVQSIAIQLFEQPDQKDHTVYLNMQIQRRHQTYDAFMICDRRTEGLACTVECDGGSADVVTVGGSQNRVQFVNKGFMVSGGCGGAQDDGEVWLEPVPDGDDVFNLEAAESCP